MTVQYENGSEDKNGSVDLRNLTNLTVISTVTPMSPSQRDQSTILATSNPVYLEQSDEKKNTYYKYKSGGGKSQ